MAPGDLALSPQARGWGAWALPLDTHARVTTCRPHLFSCPQVPPPPPPPPLPPPARAAPLYGGLCPLPGRQMGEGLTTRATARGDLPPADDCNSSVNAQACSQHQRGVPRRAGDGCILGYDPAHHSPAAPVAPLNGVGSSCPPSSHTWPRPSSPPLVEPGPTESSVGTYWGGGRIRAAPAGPPVQTGPEAHYGRLRSHRSGHRRGRAARTTPLRARRTADRRGRASLPAVSGTTVHTGWPPCR